MSFIPSVINVVDNNNSSTTPLIIDGTFNGTSTFITPYNNIQITIITDVPSSNNGLTIQFSTNNTDWDIKYNYSVSGNINFVQNIVPTGSYFKLDYKNGNVAQTTFRLQVILCTYSNNTIINAVNDNKYLTQTKSNVLGNLTTSIREPVSSYGDISVTDLDTVFQGDFIYGINNEIYKSVGINNGTVSSLSGLAIVSSGTTTNSLGYLQTLSNLRYKSGQGTVLRFSAMFSSGVSGNTQYVGGGNFLSGLYFGYNGTSFGINRLAGGVLPVQTLTVTGFATGNALSTVTLYDGTTPRNFSVPLSTINQLAIPVGLSQNTFVTAAQLASFDYATLYPGWIASSNGPTVSYVCMNAQSNNTLTFTRGTTGATATVASVVSGAQPTINENEFIAQTDWNIDVMDGTGNSNNPSGLLLIPTNGNVYQIQVQYMGFGMLTFSIENENTGLFQPVHQIKYANSFTVRNLKIPNLFFQMISRNTTNISKVDVMSGGNFGAIYGKTSDKSVTRSFNTGRTQMPASIINNYNLFSIKPSVVYNNINTSNGLYSVINIKPKTLAISNSNNVPLKVSLLLGSDQIFQSGSTLWSSSFTTTTNNTICLLNWINTTGSTLSPTNGNEIFSMVLPSNNNNVIDLDPYDCTLSHYQSLTVSINGPRNTIFTTNTYSVSLQWEEEQ